MPSLPAPLRGSTHGDYAHSVPALQDMLGETLVLIVLKAELAASVAFNNAEEAAMQMRDVAHAARVALTEVRATRGLATGVTR